MFDTLSLVPFKLIANVLIGDFVNYRVKFLAESRVCKQAQFEPLLGSLVQLPE